MTSKKPFPKSNKVRNISWIQKSGFGFLIVRKVRWNSEILIFFLLGAFLDFVQNSEIRFQILIWDNLVDFRNLLWILDIRILKSVVLIDFCLVYSRNLRWIPEFKVLEFGNPQISNFYLVEFRNPSCILEFRIPSCILKFRKLKFKNPLSTSDFYSVDFRNLRVFWNSTCWNSEIR